MRGNELVDLQLVEEQLSKVVAFDNSPVVVMVTIGTLAGLSRDIVPPP
jgi:hypothetical protein